MVADRRARRVHDHRLLSRADVGLRQSRLERVYDIRGCSRRWLYSVFGIVVEGPQIQRLGEVLLRRLLSMGHGSGVNLGAGGAEHARLVGRAELLSAPRAFLEDRRQDAYLFRLYAKSLCRRPDVLNTSGLWLAHRFGWFADMMVVFTSSIASSVVNPCSQ